MKRPAFLSQSKWGFPPKEKEEISSEIYIRFNQNDQESIFQLTHDGRFLEVQSLPENAPLVVFQQPDQRMVMVGKPNTSLKSYVSEFWGTDVRFKVQELTGAGPSKQTAIYGIPEAFLDQHAMNTVFSGVELLDVLLKQDKLFETTEYPAVAGFMIEQGPKKRCLILFYFDEQLQIAHEESGFSQAKSLVAMNVSWDAEQKMLNDRIADFLSQVDPLRANNTEHQIPVHLYSTPSLLKISQVVKPYINEEMRFGLPASVFLRYVRNMVLTLVMVSGVYAAWCGVLYVIAQQAYAQQKDLLAQKNETLHSAMKNIYGQLMLRSQIDPEEVVDLATQLYTDGGQVEASATRTQLGFISKWGNKVHTQAPEVPKGCHAHELASENQLDRWEISYECESKYAKSTRYLNRYFAGS